MKRLRTTLLATGLAAGLVALGFGGAAAKNFEDGKYDLIKPQQQTESGDKVEIVDVFWYGCPHCFKFLPVMEAYEESAPEYVEIRRMPAIFRPNWEVHARAFYTAQILEIEDQVHRKIFEAIHLDGKPLDSPEALAEFFEQFGVEQDQFLQTYNSFAVNAMVAKSETMQRAYGIRGTPTVVVQGKYRVGGNKAGSYANMIKVADALAARENQK